MRVKAWCNEDDLYCTPDLAIVVGRHDVEGLVKGNVRWKGCNHGPDGGGEVGGRENLDAILGRVGGSGTLLL